MNTYNLHLKHPHKLQSEAELLFGGLLKAEKREREGREFLLCLLLQVFWGQMEI